MGSLVWSSSRGRKSRKEEQGESLALPLWCLRLEPLSLEMVSLVCSPIQGQRVRKGFGAHEALETWRFLAEILIPAVDRTPPWPASSATPIRGMNTPLRPHRAPPCVPSVSRKL
jgi:hypothetical protein